MTTESYVQEDTAQGCALNNYCSAGGGTIEAGRQAVQSGSVGSVEASFSVAASASNDNEFSFEIILPTDATSDADTAVIPINFTTGSMNAILESVYICRVNSSCVNQETIGSESGIGFATNGGSTTRNISCSAVTFAAGDKVIITLGFNETAGHSSQNVGITPDQTMSLPFLAPASAANITVAQTEAGDSQAATLEVPGQVTSAQTEAGDTQAATLEALAQVTSAQTEAGDITVASIQAQATANITSAQTEAGDTQAATLEVPGQVTSAQAEAGDSQVATLEALALVIASQTEAGDTTVALVLSTEARSITSAQTEAGDTNAATLEAIAQVSTSLSEAGDTTAALLVGLVQLTANVAESGDTAVSALDVIVAISAALSEAGDQAAALILTQEQVTVDGVVFTIEPQRRTLSIRLDSRTLIITKY